MEELKIVAVIIIKKEFEEELLNEFKKIVDGSRTEAGNISYDLNKDIKDPLKYIILEEWESTEAIREHNSTEHFINFKKAIDGKIESLNTSIVKEVY